MKLSTLLLTGLLAFDAVLFGVFTFRPSLAPAALRDYFKSDQARAAEWASEQQAFRIREAAEARSAAARRTAQRTQLWSTLDSDDLPTLIAHLRAAGFSPALIRSVVLGRIDAKFRSRIDDLFRPLEGVPFWRPNPLETYSSKYFEAYDQIHRDRSQLVRQLLNESSSAEPAGEVSPTLRRQFGNISKAKIDLIQCVNDDYAEMTAQVRVAMEDVTLPEDHEKLALLEREKHADLAAILSPEELADYEVRQSRVTARLNSTMTLMDATEDEFRAIYRAQQPFADILYPENWLNTPEFLQQQNDAQIKVAEQIAVALGPDRYAAYLRANDFEYQQMARIGQASSVATDALSRAYDLKTSAEQESMRIYNGPGSVAEKTAALAALAQNSKASLVNLLGPSAGPTYASIASWLNALQNGYAVDMDPNGRTTAFREPRPPPKK